MKIALVHDWLVTMAGAEKVLEAIYEIYPSPIYTLIADKKNLLDVFKNSKIHTSFIQKFPFAKKLYRYYLPLMPFAIEKFDLSNYDLIISSSSAFAKSIRKNKKQLHICYCHTPLRYASLRYLKETGFYKGIKGKIAKIILQYIRKYDLKTTKRVNYFIANSNYTAKNIKKFYNREAKVIYPPVDTDKFKLCKNKEDFYLTVSRIVPYKKVDLIIEAFSKMPDKKLIVIGYGPEMKKIKIIARRCKNIKIIGYKPHEVVKNYMQKAKAFVFAAEEHFGIVVAEAQASGTPVIAYKKGGVSEIINKKTSIFLKEQKVESIINAINEFEKNQNKFKANEIRKNAEKFNKEKFKKQFKKFIDEKIKEFYNKKRGKNANE